ncbi:hypothetical protein BACCOP_03826 [Phocaeicola coprocola DSM 17136]|uniref:Uncharacterized protein n=1 Tax=Phocaeicola coprocola DSM 17136 TaxID=470145 RepID=B3JPM6_9BACT|nr:hypothetical protein BACCOP_03826 [Phocaeicola coprocola DSM 17136]
MRLASQNKQQITENENKLRFCQTGVDNKNKCGSLPLLESCRTCF